MTNKEISSIDEQIEFTKRQIKSFSNNTELPRLLNMHKSILSTLLIVKNMEIDKYNVKVEMNNVAFKKYQQYLISHENS